MRVNTDGAPFSLSSQVAFSQSFSCSQLDIATQGRYNVAANEAFCLEIIGNLFIFNTALNIIQGYFKQRQQYFLLILIVSYLCVQALKSNLLVHVSI